MFCCYRCAHKVEKQQERLGRSETPRGRNETCHNTCAHNSLARRPRRGGRTLLHTVVAIFRDQVVVSHLHKEEQQDVHSAKKKAVRRASSELEGKSSQKSAQRRPSRKIRECVVYCLASPSNETRLRTAGPRSVHSGSRRCRRTTLSRSENRAVRRPDDEYCGLDISQAPFSRT